MRIYSYGRRWFLRTRIVFAAVLVTLGLLAPGVVAEAQAATPAGRAASSSRPTGPNPYLAFLPAEATPDFKAWDRYLSSRARAERAAKAPAAAAVTLPEAEPNDDFATANPIVGFGTGDGQVREVDITGSISSFADSDFFTLELRAGDVLGVNLMDGSALLSLFDASQDLRISSRQDLSFLGPGPLPGGGRSVIAYVIESDGTYSLALENGSQSPYTLEVRLFRPFLEESEASPQVLFLDFDGATFDGDVFELSGLVTTSPLSNFLSAWGLAPADEDAVIDAILDSVAESLSQDLRVRGLNGDYDSSGRLGAFDIEILNSRDHADPFGEPNVSRVIVGGTIGELGISTIGIAESIDVGNFVLDETGIVLLDLLSGSSFDPNSLNRFPIAGGATKIELIGVGVGNIVSHEAGHFFANFHTDTFNGTSNLMDQGGNLAGLVGVGPDGIFGTVDDVDVDFGRDSYAQNEGFDGVEDTLNSIAFGLSTSAAQPLDSFVFYRVREGRQSGFERVGPLVLEDDFGPRPWNLVRPTELGLPADINDAGINDPNTHLASYAIRPGYDRSRRNPVDGVRILNECNDLYLDISRVSNFLVPSRQDLKGPVEAPQSGQHNLDHFLCHSAKVARQAPSGAPAPGFPKGMQLDVRDGFQTRRYDLKAVTKLCNPTQTSGVPFFLTGDDRGQPFPIDHASIRNPADHLVCYRAARARRYILQDGCGPSTPLLTGRIDPRQRRHQAVENVQVANAFGDQVVDTKWEVELCLPSAKDPFCGDGFLEPRLGEQCDDGNLTNGDGCDANCAPEFCGDGVVQPDLGEECEVGEDAACSRGCQSDCQCEPDPCREATVIPPAGGTFDGVLVPGESVLLSGCGGSGPEQVFSWTPDQTGLFRVDTCEPPLGLAVPIDTVLSVRDSSCSDPLAEITCNDQACFNGSSVTFMAEAGRTYFLIVDAWTSFSTGSFVLNVSPEGSVYGSAARAFLAGAEGLLD